MGRAFYACVFETHHDSQTAWLRLEESEREEYVKYVDAGNGRWKITYTGRHDMCGPPVFMLSR